MGPTGGPAPRRTGRQTVGRNITWNWTCVIALQITDPSSLIVTQINATSGHLLQEGQDTKTNWSKTVGRNVTSTSYLTGIT
jgi:hypothetical protein